jgi:hypothetical protein
MAALMAWRLSATAFLSELSWHAPRSSVVLHPSSLRTTPSVLCSRLSPVDPKVESRQLRSFMGLLEGAECHCSFAVSIYIESIIENTHALRIVARGKAQSKPS